MLTTSNLNIKKQTNLKIILFLSNYLCFSFIYSVDIKNITEKINPISYFENLAKKVNTPHKNDTAKVTPSSTLPVSEIDFINKRLKVCNKALSKALGIEIKEEHTPRIAISASGGGFRAMLSSLGFTKGLQKIGVFDGCLYTASLSGSTWFYFPWMFRNQTINDFESFIVNKISTELKYTLLNVDKIVLALARKKIFDQPVSLIDVTGACLSIKFLSDEKTNALFSTMSGMWDKIKNGEKPMPIGTAIMPLSSKKFEWFEFNPIEIGSSKLGGFIPTWAFGRRFENGISMDNSPEQPLGFLLATFGSAYEVSLQDIFQPLKKDEQKDTIESEPKFKLLQSYLSKYIGLTKEKIVQSPLGEKRLIPAEINNFLYKMNSPISDRKNITLIDAGIEFNHPIPPLLRKDRNIDIILICDASKSFKNQMQLVAQYAKNENILFPIIDLNQIEELAQKHDNSIIIFKDKNPNIPMIIYIPILTDLDVIQKTYGTFKMKFKPEESLNLIKMAEEKVLKNKEIILEAIKERISLKSGEISSEKTPIKEIKVQS